VFRSLSRRSRDKEGCEENDNCCFFHGKLLFVS
jgi:hypothetical protein